MNVINVPVVHLDSVLHVGNFDGNQDASSHEGHALSVSWCPEAWTKIARLGGRPTWLLKKDEPGRFLEITGIKQAAKRQSSSGE